MKPCILIIGTLMLLSSCATILNSDVQKIYLQHEPSLSLRIDSTVFSNPTGINGNVYIPKKHVTTSAYFLRSETPVPLIFNNTDTFRLYPHNSYFAYWFANITYTFGLGILVDNQYDDRYTYQKYNYFVKEDYRIKNNRFKPIPDNHFKFEIGLPYLNFFNIRTDSARGHNAGFWGISAGIDYFMKNDYYLSLHAGAATNYFMMFPAPINLYGNVETSSTSYIDLRINKITPRIEYGIGLNISQMRWNEEYWDETDSTDVVTIGHHRSDNIGFSSTFRYRCSPLFSVGFLYQPQFYDFYNNQFYYQHLISIELVWRL